MQIAHIRNGQIIERYEADDDGMAKGWVTLENGDKVSPAVVGFSRGVDRVVPVVVETQDTSTGPNIVKTIGDWQVEADRVYRLTTIRDKTAQELDADAQLRATSSANETALRLLKLVMSAQFAIVNKDRVDNGLPELTVDQYLNWLSSTPTLSDAKFIAKLKEILS